MESAIVAKCLVGGLQLGHAGGEIGQLGENYRRIVNFVRHDGVSEKRQATSDKRKAINGNRKLCLGFRPTYSSIFMM